MKKIKETTLKNAPNYLIIGDGKLAKHFSFYFKKLNLQIATWSRKKNSAKNLLRKVDSATHVLLAINDSNIDSFYRKLDSKKIAGFKNKIFIHFSGALSFKNIFAAHPLMTFGSRLYSLKEYKKIHFVIEDVNSKNFNLSSILPGLKNSYSLLSSDKKTYYHAQCVIGGNFPHILWKNSLLRLTQMKVPKEVVYSYFQRNLDNFILDSDNSLTGPLARKDVKTIKEHLKSFNSAQEKKLYRAFVDFQKVGKT